MKTSQPAWTILFEQIINISLEYLKPYKYVQIICI